MDTPTALPIGEVARRSGFSTDTLRYYERLGLMPAPARTEVGRRAYDLASLDRLRFIARAKDLGCSLDEIASLLSAWDADCSDVQANLRSLVDRRIGDPQRRVAELVAFTAQLQEARHALAEAAGLAVDGPCGPCGSIACTLDHEDMATRLSEWQAVLGEVTGRASIDDGIRLTLAPSIDLGAVAHLTRAEWACCSFFAFGITVDGRGTAIEVRAPVEARDLVTAVFGAA